MRINLPKSCAIVYFHDVNSRRLLDAIEKTQHDLEELKQLLAEITDGRVRRCAVYTVVYTGAEIWGYLGQTWFLPNW